MGQYFTVGGIAFLVTHSVPSPSIPVGRALNEVTLCCCKDGCGRRERGGRRGVRRERGEGGEG